jgi:capsular polysaccharide biosynthesis protein
VGHEHLIECHVGRRYRFRSLQVVRTAGSAPPSGEEARFLYDTLAPGQRPKGARRYFLVRDAGTRLPANQAEVDAVFKDFRVEKVNPARLTYLEQQTLFAEAEVIIGVFGTELYCMLNMHPGTSVIELIWDANHANVYGHLCRFLGMNHELVVCERALAAGRAQYKLDGDLIVDCSRLRAALAAATSSTPK